MVLVAAVYSPRLDENQYKGMGAVHWKKGVYDTIESPFLFFRGNTKHFDTGI